MRRATFIQIVVFWFSILKLDIKDFKQSLKPNKQGDTIQSNILIERDSSGIKEPRIEQYNEVQLRIGQVELAFARSDVVVCVI